MIISDFSNYLKKHEEELLAHKVISIELLHSWLEKVISKVPRTNVDKIVHKELMYLKNDLGAYMIVGKSDSGRVLLNALIEFAKSYDNYIHAKWLEMTEKNYHSKSDNS